MRHHPRQYGLREPHGAHESHRVAVVPLLRRCLKYVIPIAKMGGIIYQHIDSLRLSCRNLYSLLDVVWRGNIRVSELSPAAGRGDFRHDRFTSLAINIGREYPRALMRKNLGDHAANAMRRARYNGHFVFESIHDL